MSSLVVSVGKKPDESVSLSYPDEMSDGGEVEELDVGEGEEDGVTVKVTIDPVKELLISDSSASQEWFMVIFRSTEVSQITAAHLHQLSVKTRSISSTDSK